MGGASGAARLDREEELSNHLEAKTAEAAALSVQLSNLKVALGHQEELLAKMDDNGDGFITRIEYMRHFDRIDEDGDGMVTREEFRRGFWILASQSPGYLEVASQSIKEAVEEAVLEDRRRAQESAQSGQVEAEPVTAAPRKSKKPLKPYAVHGQLPAGFPAAEAFALVWERQLARQDREYEKADALQAQLMAMGKRTSSNSQRVNPRVS